MQSSTPAPFDPLQLTDPLLADALFKRPEVGPESSVGAFPMPSARELGMPVRCAGVGELLGAYADGQISPVDVVAELSTAIELDPAGREAILAMVPGIANMAEQSAQRWKSGNPRPLEGIPFGIKDIIDVEGASVTSGSLFTGERRAPRDADAVARLREAGAIPFAMVATTEFASGSQHNPRYGTVTNPWDAARWAGGSSTGSGAALAARLIPFALGTDTAGSIRVPACWCGIAGLKPTRDLVSRTGVSPLSWTMDHVGPMARSAADLARVLPFMAAQPNSVLMQESAGLLQGGISLDGVRIGVPSNWFNERCDGAVLANWQAALEVFERQGCVLVNMPTIDAQSFWKAGWTILSSELAANHVDRVEFEDMFDKRLFARLLESLEIKAVDYALALRTRKHAQDAFLTAMQGLDCIVMPGIGGVAAPLENLSIEIDGVPQPFMDIVSRNTIIFDMIGFPALMLPSGLSRAGLPTGIQVVARPHADALCLKAAMAFEQVTGYFDNCPSRLHDLKGPGRMD